MTQIVYDGSHLLADRVGYLGNKKFDTPKLKSTVLGGYIYHYAFAGSFIECNLGEAVVESGFDEEVMKYAVSRLTPEQLENGFHGIVVQVPVQPERFNQRRVWLCNYAGDRCEVSPLEFIAVGSFSDHIHTAKQTLDLVCPGQVFPTEQIVRAALKGTAHDQTGRIIDVVDLLPE